MLRMGGAAAIHFALSNLILPFTLALAGRSADSPEGPGLAVILLVRVTRLLHFPLVTLALYPREWFPGNWVYVPMALNSLIWGACICTVVALFRRTR
jgi:hypothetical protein